MKYSELIVRAYFRECKLPPAETEFKFHPERKWRFDWAWPEKKIALEIQGGLFVQGRHNRGPALVREHEKLNHAAALGWRVLYCQPQDLCTADLVELLRKALSC